MTNQLQGEILFAGWTGDTASAYVYTPWMPVRGDVATFGVEVVQNSGVSLDWNVETRTLESPTATSVFSTAPSAITGVGTYSATSSGTLPATQLVRYRFKTGTPDVSKYVVLRALQPSWQANR